MTLTLSHLTLIRIVWNVRKFLSVVRDAGLTLNLSKCKFAQTSVPFVGYIAGSGRFFPDPSKVEAIRNMKESQTETEVRRALGIFSFYRNHVENFARIARPLTDLTSGRSPLQFHPSAKERSAFMELQRRISMAPILARPRSGEAFCLYSTLMLASLLSGVVSHNLIIVVLNFQ